MTAILLRLIIFMVVIGFVAFSARKLWRDWTGAFRVSDRQRQQRDLAERGRPDVITLERDDDGVYRPNGRNDPRA